MDFTEIMAKPVAEALEKIRKEAYEEGYKDGYDAGIFDVAYYDLEA